MTLNLCLGGQNLCRNFCKGQFCNNANVGGCTTVEMVCNLACLVRRKPVKPYGFLVLNVVIFNFPFRSVSEIPL